MPRYTADGSQNTGHYMAFYSPTALLIQPEFNLGQISGQGSEADPDNSGAVAPKEKEPLSMKQIWAGDYGGDPYPPVDEAMEQDDDFYSDEMADHVRKAQTGESSRLVDELATRLEESGVRFARGQLYIRNVNTSAATVI